jgi:hypothetical protein
MKGKITKRDALFFFLGALVAGIINYFFNKNATGMSLRDYIRDAMNRNKVS